MLMSIHVRKSRIVLSILVLLTTPLKMTTSVFLKNCRSNLSWFHQINNLKASEAIQNNYIFVDWGTSFSEAHRSAFSGYTAYR